MLIYTRHRGTAINKIAEEEKPIVVNEEKIDFTEKTTKRKNNKKTSIRAVEEETVEEEKIDLSEWLKDDTE